MMGTLLARRMAEDIGVDRLSCEITDHPQDLYSKRFVPGSPDYGRIVNEIWDNTGLGNAIPGATPLAKIDVRAAIPGLPVVARRGKAVTVKTTVRNESRRPFPATATYGRRLVRLGAQLCTRDGVVINRDYERAWLPHNLEPGRAVDISMTITAPPEPGRYALKFDLVSEGIDWFESHGSPVTMKPLVVL